MPDITMCASDVCDLRTKCYRSPESGTKPSEYRQAWFLDKAITGASCCSYWPTRDATKRDATK